MGKNNKLIEKVDILNRGEFIDRVVKLVDLISARKGNMTFAINGEWGCGKTFVLEEIQKRLEKDEKTNYLVIPYNCWQYDYYDEPLVAIVSALLDYAETTNIVPEDMKIALKEIVLKVGTGIVTRFIKEKSGIDIAEAVKDAKDAIKGTKDGIKDAHDFDSFYSFKKALAVLKEQLEELADIHTIVLAVDELDRCLPEYSIKVLERLHHITEDVPNMITIVAVDKQRLNHTVSSIFGDGSAENYLKKFIRFEVALDNGKQDSTRFFDKFTSYYNRFEDSLSSKLKETDLFLAELFDGIDIRSREQIVEKAAIVHDICFGDEKLDLTVMYMELFYSLLFYHYRSDSIFQGKKTIRDRKGVFGFYNDIPTKFNERGSGFCKGLIPVIHNFEHAGGFRVDPFNIFLIATYYWYIIPNSKDEFSIGADELFPFVDSAEEGSEGLLNGDNTERIRRYVELLKTIG